MSFQFAILDEGKKFRVSLIFLWTFQQQEIIAFIDKLLVNAIESSPHTTLTQPQNRSLCNYSRYLGDHWRFGTEDEEAATKRENDEDDNDDDDDDLVDVVETERGLALRSLTTMRER
ncbi:MAG: hypothetical protein M1837_000714 [Sclerophora amabilis]|nr:MAG: hypothetical protein M1837_000714 [Sclerophora amabilis]